MSVREAADGQDIPSVFVAPEGRGEACEDEDDAEDSKGRVDLCFLGGVRHGQLGKRGHAPGRMGLRSGRAMVWQMRWRWHWQLWMGKLG